MEPLLAALAIVLQAFFAGSETSLVRANWVRIVTWANENRPWARTARSLLLQRDLALISTLVGVNLAIVAASGLTERFCIRALGPGYTMLSVIIVSLASLAVGAFLPKALAATLPEDWLAYCAPGIRLAMKCFYPLDWLLARLTGVRRTVPQEFPLSRKDFLFALRERARASGSHHTSGIAARLLDFPRVLATDVMTPISRVVAIPEGIAFEKLRELIREHRFSRYPVYRQEVGNVVGVLHVRDLLELPRYLVRKPYFVPEHARAIDIMNRMREQAVHFAVVQDSGSRAIGIVTFEDLLEELVGEIRSEE